MGSLPPSKPSMSSSDDVVGLDTLLRIPGRVVLPPVSAAAAHSGSTNPGFAQSQRHEVNPAIALNLISDIHTVVLRYRDQLREIVKALNVMQAQGPMVDGWLESSADAEVGSSADAATILRHGDADALMQYIESLDSTSTGETPAAAQSAQRSASDPLATSPTATQPSTATTEYRLCCLDEDGQVQSQHCPPEQMGFVSVAIARYQNYKQLLIKKQAVEAKLEAVVAQLGKIRDSLETN